MWNAGLDASQALLKNGRRNINSFRYADDTTLMAESKEELKNLLMKLKEKSEKGGLKLNIQKTKVMASGSITSWQIDGGKMETVRDFIFLGSKMVVTGAMKLKEACFWKKSYDQPRQILKSIETLLYRQLTAKELMLLNYGIENYWEFFGLQGNKTS